MLRKVQEAFAGCRRPEHFADHAHCEECAEADELFRARDIDTLSISDVGSPNSPMSLITPEGFVYYLPALVRVALDEPDDFHGWYGAMLIGALRLDGRRNARYLACTPEQRRVVVEVLDHLAETRANWVDSELCADELFQTMEIWSDEIPST